MQDPKLAFNACQVYLTFVKNLSVESLTENLSAVIVPVLPILNSASDADGQGGSSGAPSTLADGATLSATPEARAVAAAVLRYITQERNEECIKKALVDVRVLSSIEGVYTQLGGKPIKAKGNGKGKRKGKGRLGPNVSRASQVVLSDGLQPMLTLSAANPVQRRRGGDVSPADVEEVRNHLGVLVALIRQHANFAVKRMGLQELHKLLSQHPKGGMLIGVIVPPALGRLCCRLTVCVVLVFFRDEHVDISRRHVPFRSYRRAWHAATHGTFIQ